MDYLLPQLLAFPPHPPPALPLSDVEYDRQIRGLLQTLNQTRASMLISGVPNGGDLLDILDPSINTLPYLYTLLAHINASTSSNSNTRFSRDTLPTGKLWPYMVAFAERFDPTQVRYAGNEWRSVLECLAISANNANKPITAIRPIRTAMLRLDPHLSTFTSTHTIFMQLCVSAKSYRAALPILDSEFTLFPDAAEDYVLPAQSKVLPCSNTPGTRLSITYRSGLTGRLTYQDFFQYNLWGALIWIGLRRYAKAELLLSSILVAPSDNITSTMTVRAYKLWLLVALIDRAEFPAVPRTTNNQVARSCRAIAKPYDALAEKFISGDATKLRGEIEAGRLIWRMDRTEGLVNQLPAVQRRASISDLSKVYSALSLPSIAQRTSPTPTDLVENERFIYSYSASGGLEATISSAVRSKHDPSSASSADAPTEQQTPAPQPPVLRFASSDIQQRPHATSEESLAATLPAQTRQIMDLAAQVKELDGRLALRRDYIDWVKKARKNRENAGVSADPGWDDGPVDEDMMTD
ncbi:MAG: hypothetical protein M1819_001011 [Sarea resinae]|nr:MAG: hypothetical protein M1819_001011 [Sarea resinae]